jgi:asparagine synthase (glutamine-hydrolysing)
MSRRPFVARFADAAGRIDGAQRLSTGLAERGPVAVRATPGLELAWNGQSGSEPPGSGRTVCLVDGRVNGLDALAAELEIETDDAGLLARGYERFGEAVLTRVRGSFTLLLWDRELRRGIVARDQLGGRPLFFSDQGSEQLVASEIRDLLPASSRAPNPDRIALANWLARRPPPGTRTLFAGISRLPAGRLIRVGDHRAVVHRWWTPAYKEPRALAHPEAVEELRDAMSAAVERALRPAAVPGLMLSGGLDSSCVAGLTHELGCATRAYSGVFPAHPRVDESARVKVLAEHLGIDVHEHAFAGGSALDAAAEYTERWALPPLSPNWFVWEPLYETARADGVDVMLDGEGGDELFGCSPRLLADLLVAGRLRQLIAQARRIPGMGPDPKRQWLSRAFSQYALRGAVPPTLHTWARTMRARGTGQAWLSKEALGLLDRDSNRDAWKRITGPRWWASLAFSLVDGPDLMAAQDEGGRAGGLRGFEVAHPWRDLSLVDLVLSLPPQLAFDPDLDRPLAREAVRDLVPDGVRLSEHKPFFNDLLDDALATTDAPQLAQLLRDPPEAVAWALEPGGIDGIEGPRRSLVGWRVATACLWGRTMFG